MVSFFRPPNAANDFYMGQAPTNPFDQNYDRYQSSVRKQAAMDTLRHSPGGVGLSFSGPNDSSFRGGTQMSGRAPLYGQTMDQSMIDQMLGGGQVQDAMLRLPPGTPVPPMGNVTQSGMAMDPGYASRPTPGNMPTGTYGAPTQQLQRPQAPQAPTPIRDNRQEIARLQQGREDPRQAQRIQYLERQNAATRMGNQNPQFAANRQAIAGIQDRMASGNMGENRIARAKANIDRMRTQNRGIRNG